MEGQREQLREGGAWIPAGRVEPAGIAIVTVVSAAFGVGVEALCAGRRGPAETSFARQVAMYLAHTHSGMPLVAAGRLFRRDRTTARHACRRVEERREDPRVDSLLDCLERALDLSAEVARFRARGGARV